MKRAFMKPALLAVCVSIAACATNDASVTKDSNAAIRSSFVERGIAKLDRLEQTELQKTCSQYAGRELPPPVAEALQKAALSEVKYPADGVFIGDWKEGEKIAQNGRGLQFSDAAGSANGGNCYACHQIQKAEISYGNLGPSLYQFGKLRSGGAAQPPEAIVRYTWGKLWNSHSYNACTNMPRYGAAGILTEQQLKHVMALLLDPQSPVNTQ
jgi:L-cysteine S-thiosulfotransferase